MYLCFTYVLHCFPKRNIIKCVSKPQSFVAIWITMPSLVICFKLWIVTRYGPLYCVNLKIMVTSLHFPHLYSPCLGSPKFSQALINMWGCPNAGHLSFWLNGSKNKTRWVLDHVFIFGKALVTCHRLLFQDKNN